MRMPRAMIGALLGLLAALLLGPATGAAIGRLGSARADRAALADSAAAPAEAAPIVSQSLAFPAGDMGAARTAMLARIDALARSGGVLVEERAPAVAPHGLVALKIALSGPEKSVIVLADAVERQQPAMRFRSWRIEPVPGGVRLTGELIGALR